MSTAGHTLKRSLYKGRVQARGLCPVAPITCYHSHFYVLITAHHPCITYKTVCKHPTSLPVLPGWLTWCVRTSKALVDTLSLAWTARRSCSSSPKRASMARLTASSAAFCSVLSAMLSCSTAQHKPCPKGNGEHMSLMIRHPSAGPLPQQQLDAHTCISAALACASTPLPPSQLRCALVYSGLQLTRKQVQTTNPSRAGIGQLWQARTLTMRFRVWGSRCGHSP